MITFDNKPAVSGIVVGGFDTVKVGGLWYTVHLNRVGYYGMRVDGRSVYGAVKRAKGLIKNIQSLVSTIPAQDITRFHKSIKAYHPNSDADEHSPAGQAHKKGHIWARATQGPGINRRWIFDGQGNYLGYVDGQQEACVFYDVGNAW